MLMTKRLWLVAVVLVLIGITFGAVAFIVSANWIAPVILVTVFCVFLWKVFRTHIRPEDASDADRLAAGKALDERDRHLSQSMFAGIGMVALPLAVIGSYSILVFDALDAAQVVHAQFAVLLLTAAATSGYVIRRK